MIKIVTRIYTYFLFKFLRYLRRKLLLTSVIVGPQDRAHISKNCDLQDVILNTNSGHIYIGEHTFFGSGCMVLTGSHYTNYRDRQRQQDHPREGRDIHIGRGVWIASGAIICGNVRIADDVVIAAGSVVIKDCPEAAIYGGIPAKKIKSL